jgi:aminoglycoside phosphotransferase family enzyme/predicted kinase
MVNISGETNLGQAKVLESMGRPEAYDPPPATVERIETHASFVFLAGDFAYKVKRAVKYPFLDFSTLEKRHQACLNELRINTRTAPQLYLEVVPISIDADGAFRLRGKGDVVEWALVMRRFDQDGLYDRMAAEERLTLDAMAPLAAVIAAFHARADRTLTQDQAVVPLEGVILEHEELLTERAEIFPPDAARHLGRRSREAFESLAPLLRERAQGGYVRHCHGDLHLRNIVEISGAPVLFDALEFDDRLATIDVLYDLAFLLMDLGRRGLCAHANAVLNAYLDDGGSGNLLGLATLPLFLSLRAMIRAKVELMRAQGLDAGEAARVRDDALGYFDLAGTFLAPARAHLVAIGGLSGSGKSAVARAIAPGIGPFPGAVIVRSDVERKRLFGVTQDETLPQRAYAPRVSAQVYAMCRKRAALALAAGRLVIVDAVHAKPDERDAVAAVAATHGAAFTGLWLDAPIDVARARLATRQGDVSDATPAVVETQAGYDLGAMTFDRIDGSLPVEEVAALCCERIAAKS